jgi:glycosyltransferase involved in cell wall biosynthesis
MRSPLFSIVTVCRDDLENLRQTVVSVAAQTFSSLEHVVWDGVSTDGTQDFLSRSGVHCYRSAPDGGIFDAMNKALALCSGKYIHFLNAGDVFHDLDVLSRIAQATSSWPDAGLLYGDVLYPCSVRPFSVQPEKLTPFLLFRGTVCHQAWFVKREVYESLGGFDTQLRYKGDYDALLRMIYILQVKSKHLPTCVAVYKGGGFSEKNLQNAKPEFDLVRRKYLSRSQAAFYAVALGLLDPIRKAFWFQRLRAAFAKRQARNSWG